MNTMQGIRLATWPMDVFEVPTGSYGPDPEGTWRGIAPNGLMCNLKGHSVIEHEDGAVTVSPSILVSNRDSSWHGYLEHGVWREC